MIKVENRLGGSLLNVTISLIIIIALITAAAYHSGVMLNEGESRDEAETIYLLADQARHLKSKDGYKETLTADLIELGLLPPLLHGDLSSKKITNRWGGQVDVIAQDDGANFAINYRNMPEKLCLKTVGEVRSGILYSMGKGFAHNREQSIHIGNRTPKDIKEMCSEGNGLNRIVYFSTRSP